MSCFEVVGVVPIRELVKREVGVRSNASGSAFEFLAYRMRKSSASYQGPSPKDTLPAVFEGSRHSVRRLKSQRICRQLNASARGPELRLNG